MRSRVWLARTSLCTLSFSSQPLSATTSSESFDRNLNVIPRRQSHEAKNVKSQVMVAVTEHIFWSDEGRIEIILNALGGRLKGEGVGFKTSTTKSRIGCMSG
jgi:hypothetical protein